MGEASTRSGTRTVIVESAARLLSEQGPAAVTTRGVAEAAGVQAPTIYRLFGDKDGLLDAVAEHVMATYVSAKAEVVAAASAADVDPVTDLREGWQTNLDFGLANPALFVLLNDPVRRPPSPAAERGTRVLEQRVHRVALSGRLAVSEARAVDLVHAAGTGAVLSLLASPPDQRDTTLADDLLQAVLHRILGEDPGHPVGDHVASVVALRAHTPHLHGLTEAERALLVQWLDRVVDAG